MANFEGSHFDYHTIESDGRGGFDVYGHGTYEESSVLAGRAKRAYRENFDTEEQAVAAYPDANVVGSSKIDGYNSGDLMSHCPEPWFDPMDAGEAWGEDDY